MRQNLSSFPQCELPPVSRQLRGREWKRGEDPTAVLLEAFIEAVLLWIIEVWMSILTAHPMGWAQIRTPTSIICLLAHYFFSLALSLSFSAATIGSLLPSFGYLRDLIVYCFFGQRGAMSYSRTQLFQKRYNKSTKVPHYPSSQFVLLHILSRVYIS